MTLIGSQDNIIAMVIGLRVYGFGVPVSVGSTVQKALVSTQLPIHSAPRYSDGVKAVGS